MASTSTKRQIVTGAYEECSLAGYEFDITPEEQVAALRQLDAIMREWQPSLPLGYNFPASIGSGDLDDPSGIPDYAFDVACKYLALRVMPKMGKSMSGESRYALAAGLNVLRAQASFIPNATLPATTVRGSGNRWRNAYRPFITNDIANSSPSLGTLSLMASAATTVASFATVILGTLSGSTLSFVTNPGNLYSLSFATTGSTNGIAVITWTLTRAAGGVAGTERPVVQEMFNGAYNSPSSAAFSVVVT
jgi:hypothetical protein